jgi:hypothetical protein
VTCFSKYISFPTCTTYIEAGLAAAAEAKERAAREVRRAAELRDAAAQRLEPVVGPLYKFTHSLKAAWLLPLRL